MTINSKFIEILISNGAISKETLESINKRPVRDEFEIALLMKSGDIDIQATKYDLGHWWASSIGFSYVDLTKTLFQAISVQKLPRDFASKNKIIPIYQIGDAITVATADPANQMALKEAAQLIGVPVSPVFSFPDEIEDAIAIQYQTDSSIKEITDKIFQQLVTDANKQISLEKLKEIAGDKAVIELVQSILLLGLKENASDIHIEPFESRVKILFRIDGVLHERKSFGRSILPPMISRLKILSKTDITENRGPQDGRISIPLSHRSIDFRFATAPTIWGEKVTVRILGQAQSKEIPRLNSLGLSAKNFNKIKEIINTPNGVIFVTGPTGSGKTTTLFSILNHLNKPDTHILTIEDPVEYRLDGINQVQVNPAVDLDFAKALRSFLRHDPDIILVGEIRDLETAKIASQAALTGHLVMATMHTNNSLQAITRLVEIGVEPFLVAPSVIGVVAQRLVRKICDHCKEKYSPPPDQIEEIFVEYEINEVSFYRGKGCDKCHNSGYSGREAIHEVFIVDEQVRDFIARNSSILDINKYVERDESEFQSLRYDGLKKVLRGITTIDEINKVAPKELKANF